jgi:hypothetical protein
MTRVLSGRPPHSRVANSPDAGRRIQSAMCEAATRKGDTTRGSPRQEHLVLGAHQEPGVAATLASTNETLPPAPVRGNDAALTV